MNVTLAPLHWCLDNVEWNRSDFYWLYFCHFLYWDLTILSMLSLQRHKLPISCLELFFCIHGMSKHFQMTIRENNFNNYIISTIQTECQYLLSLPKNRSFVKMFTFWKIVNGHLINTPTFLPINPNFPSPDVLSFNCLCLCKAVDDPTLICVSYPYPQYVGVS